MRVVGLVLLLGCGRVGFDARGDAPSDMAADAFVLPTTPFSAAVPVSVLNVPGVEDDEPTLTNDLLEIVFESERGGSDHLYTAKRDASTDTWGPVTPLLNGNSPALTGDGLTLYYHDADFAYVTTRGSRQEAFLPGIPVPGIPMSYKVSATTEDGLVAYLTFFTASDSYDVFIATRTDVAGTFGPPVRADLLSTVRSDGAPHLFGADSHVVVSTAPGTGTGEDIAIAPIVDGAPQTAVLVPEVSTPVDDEDPWMSLDGRVLFFMSYVGDPAGDLYMATR